MTYIIAEPCIDIKDLSCVDVCSVDCIHQAERILVIDPEECIDCFAPEETSYPHLHPETVLARDEDGTVDTRQYILSEMPDYLLADDSGWSIPDLYRTMPIDADGPWADPDVDFWVDAAALCARAADVR